MSIEILRFKKKTGGEHRDTEIKKKNRNKKKKTGGEHRGIEIKKNKQKNRRLGTAWKKHVEGISRTA